MKYCFIFLFLFLLQGISFAQNRVIDSLHNLIKVEQDDTNKVIHLNLISREFENIGEYDTAFRYGNTALQLSNSLSVPVSMSVEKSGKGWGKGIGQAYNNIGIIYWERGNYSKALESHMAALKIREDVGDKKGIAASYNNIGIIYEEQGNFDKALESHFASLEIKKEINDKKGMGSSYNNIGLTYAAKASHIGNVDSAEKYYNKALENHLASLLIDKKIGDKRLIGTDYNNIGVMYYDKAESGHNTDSTKKYYDKALENYLAGLEIRKEINDKKGIVSSYFNIGNVYFKKNNIAEAKKQALLSLNLAETIGAKERIKENYRFLSLCDSAVGDWKAAYEDHKLYKQYNDSIFNEQSAKKVAELNAGYESERKEEQIVLLEKDRQKEKAVIISVVTGLFLALIFLVLIFNRWRMTQKQKKIIEEQKLLVDKQNRIVEEKNKNITDSINYAKLIQQAKLPNKQEILNAFPQSFVLYKPKDIVSGDFHYFHKNQSHLYIAAADCTGHGVPGAFMSIICSEKLDEALTQYSSTNEILNHINKGIKKSLHQSDKDGTSRDGMDIALCAVRLNNNGASVQYSGAYRPLWIVRRGAEEVEEIKATKKAIGGFTENNQQFELNEVQLLKGDTFYIFTDGYADQFGGDRDKKLTTKKFKQILIDIQDKPMPDQEKHLDALVENWKRNTAQLDDILVIGVRV